MRTSHGAPTGHKLFKFISISFQSRRWAHIKRSLKKFKDMLGRFQILILASCLSSCVFLPDYSARHVKSKQELIEWYSDNLTRYPAISKFGYAGSDETYHYFIVRPVDDFVTHEVPRSDLKMPDERPRSERGKSLYFYLVDPTKGFKKMPEP